MFEALEDEKQTPRIARWLRARVLSVRRGYDLLYIESARPMQQYVVARIGGRCPFSAAFGSKVGFAILCGCRQPHPMRPLAGVLRQNGGAGKQPWHSFRVGRTSRHWENKMRIGSSIFTLFLSVTVVICSATYSVEARADIGEKELQHLASKINRQYELLRSWDGKSVGQLKEIADLSCTLLGTLTDDPAFVDVISKYAEGQYVTESRDSVKQVVNSFESWVQYAIVDREILLKSGLSEDVVDEILAEMLRTRDQLDAFKIDAKSLMESISSARSVLCHAAQEFNAQARNEAILQKSGLALTIAAGIGAAVANIVLAGPTSGITILSASSGTSIAMNAAFKLIFG